MVTSRSSQLVAICCIALGALAASGCSDAPDLAETVPAPTTEDGGLDARAVILRLEDVPSGFVEDPPDEEDDDDSEEESEDCFDRAIREAGFDPGFWDESGRDGAEVQFSRDRIEFLLAWVRQTPEAGAIVGALPEAFAACDGETDADGSTVSVLPVEFPRLGDRTFAVRLEAEGYFPVSLLYVVVVERDVVILAAHGGLDGAPDAELLQRSLETMLDRL